MSTHRLHKFDFRAHALAHAAEQLLPLFEKVEPSAAPKSLEGLVELAEKQDAESQGGISNKKTAMPRKNSPSAILYLPPDPRVEPEAMEAFRQAVRASRQDDGWSSAEMRARKNELLCLGTNGPPSAREPEAFS